MDAVSQITIEPKVEPAPPRRRPRRRAPEDVFRAVMMQLETATEVLERRHGAVRLDADNLDQVVAVIQRLRRVCRRVAL